MLLVAFSEILFDVVTPFSNSSIQLKSRSELGSIFNGEHCVFFIFDPIGIKTRVVEDNVNKKYYTIFLEFG